MPYLVKSRGCVCLWVGYECLDTGPLADLALLEQLGQTVSTVDSASDPTHQNREVRGVPVVLKGTFGLSQVVGTHMVCSRCEGLE